MALKKPGIKDLKQEVKVLQKQLKDEKIINTSLRHQINNYQFITENILEMIWIFDVEMKCFTYVSPSVKKVLGYTTEEFLSLTLTNIFPLHSLQKLELLIREGLPHFLATKEKTEYTETFELYHKKGSKIWVESLFYPHENTKNGRIETIGTSRVVNEKVRMERDLIESEAKFRALFLSAGDATLVFQDERIIECNDKSLSLLKGTREEIINLHPWEFSPVYQPDGRSSQEKAKELINHVFKGESIKFEWRHMKKDGELFDAEVSLSMVDNEQKIFIAILRDITERKKAEKDLKESEEQNRIIIDNIPIVIWKSDASGKTIFVSKNVETVYGYTSEEIYKYGTKVWLERIHPDDVKRTQEKFGRLFTHKEPFDVEYRIKTKSGKWIWLHDIADKTYMEGGKQVAFGVFHDISERKSMENEFKRSEEKFRNLFNAVSDAILIIDLEGKMLEINEAATKRYGYTREEFLKLHPKDYIAPEYFKHLTSRIGSLRSEELKTYESVHIAKNGEEIPVESSIRKIFYDDKPAILALSRDISERKEMQRKLFNTMIEAEERERERYAKELHDGLGPILSTCKIYFHTINVLKDEKKKKEHIHRTGELLEDALQSIKDISNNLSPHILRNYGLGQALQSFVSKLEHITKIQFSITSNLRRRFPETIEFTLYRILVELINNSLKHSQAKTIKIVLHKKANKTIISYSDDGIGFDYKMVKSAKKGFGLLNLENRIKEIGGTYYFQTAPNCGTIVNISLKNTSP